MKLKASIALITATTMLAGLASAQDAPAPQPAQPAAPVPAEQMKKDVAYFLGYQNGTEMGRIGGLTMDDIDKDAFLQGLADAMAGKSPSEADQGTMQQSLMQFQGVITKRIEEIAKKNLEDGNKFLEENAKKDGIVKTESGLQYKIETKGEGKKYSEADYKNPMFSIKYKGTKTDGSVFDESGDTPIEMGLQVIRGFEEALKMMPVGSKWTVYIPADLAYGEQGSPPRIGPNETLIFQLEMVDIKEGPEMNMNGGMISPEQLQEMLKAQGIDTGEIEETEEVEVTE